MRPESKIDRSSGSNWWIPEIVFDDGTRRRLKTHKLFHSGSVDEYTQKVIYRWRKRFDKEWESPMEDIGKIHFEKCRVCNNGPLIVMGYDVWGTNILCLNCASEFNWANE